MFDLKITECKQRKIKCNAWRDVLGAKILNGHWADWRDERTGPNNVGVSLSKGPDPHRTVMVWWLKRLLINTFSFNYHSSEDKHGLSANQLPTLAVKVYLIPNVVYLLAEITFHLEWMGLWILDKIIVRCTRGLAAIKGCEQQLSIWW